MSYFEPDVEERIKAAREYAQRVLSGFVESVDDFTMALKNIIANARGMGVFDDYFKKRTLDELVFEAELLTGRPKDNVDYGSKILNDNKEEAESLFDGLEDHDAGDIALPDGGSFDQNLPPPNVEDSQFWKDAAEFMKTGEFKEPEAKGK